MNLLASPFEVNTQRAEKKNRNSVKFDDEVAVEHVFFFNGSKSAESASGSLHYLHSCVITQYGGRLHLFDSNLIP